MPRAIGIAAVLLYSFLALDVFAGDLSAIQLVGFLVHLLPSLAQILLLVFAWRFPYVGGIVYLVLGLAPVMLLSNSPWVNLSLAAPLFLTGILFIAQAWYAYDR